MNLYCPVCKTKKTVSVEEIRTEENEIRTQHKCIDCGHVFYTLPMSENRVVTNEYNYTDACNKIRELTGKDTMYYPDQLENGIQEVYEAGLAAGGGGEGEMRVSDWWKIYTDNYTRTAYRYGFYGSGWTDDTFVPDQPLYPIDGRYMFQNSSIQYINPTTVRFENCSEVRNMFQSSKIVDVYMNVRAALSLDYTFSNCPQLKKVFLEIDEDTLFTANTFLLSDNITELFLNGSLGKNGFNISNLTKITKDSLSSILQTCNIPGSAITITLPKTYGGTTDSTEDLCASDTDLSTHYATARSCGYTFVFA